MRLSFSKPVSAFLLHILSHTQFVAFPVGLRRAEKAAVCAVDPVLFLIRQDALHTAQRQFHAVAVKSGLLFCQMQCRQRRKQPVGIRCSTSVPIRQNSVTCSNV